jgi:hypothetical protein
MKFVAYGRGTQRILFRDLEVAAPAVVWRCSHEKENATPQQRAQFLCVALQSLEGQWLLLNREHRLCGTLKRSRSLRCNETIGECMEVMRLIRKPSRPGLTSSENPHILREVVRDSPKVNVWCSLMKGMIIGPFSSWKPQ